MRRTFFSNVSLPFIGLCLLFILSACSEKTETESSAMFRADIQRSGNFQTTGPQTKPEILWRYHAEVGASSSPVSSGNLIFSGRFDGLMLALNTSTLGCQPPPSPVVFHCWPQAVERNSGLTPGGRATPTQVLDWRATG